MLIVRVLDARLNGKISGGSASDCFRIVREASSYDFPLDILVHWILTEEDVFKSNLSMKELLKIFSHEDYDGDGDGDGDPI
jgi:hypothetical protein